jgi:Holliday junction resolvase RusA-like endonuclease
MQELIFNVEPCAKPRMTRSDKWKKRPCVIKYRKFCDALRLEAEKNNYSPGNSLSLTFHISMPKSWSKKKKAEMEGKPHQQRPDLDNLLKAFKDALLKEDSNVHTYITICKVWSSIGHISVLK